MRHRIGMAIICLDISTVLYLLLGIGMFFLFFSSHDGPVGLALGIFMLLFCLALVVGIQVVAYGLRRRKFWAWIAGLCIFSLYAPSLFCLLGVLGLWGLLDEGSRAEFGVGQRRRSTGNVHRELSPYMDEEEEE